MRKLLHECMVGDVIEMPGYAGTKGGVTIRKIKQSRMRSYLIVHFEGHLVEGKKYTVTTSKLQPHSPVYDVNRFTPVIVISESGEDYSI